MSHLILTTERPEPPKDEKEDFKSNVAEWLRLDDQIRKLQVAVRERRVHQRALNESIQRFMTKYEYDDITTPQGNLCTSVRHSRVPLRPLDIRQQILELHGLSGEELVQRIFDSERPVVERVMLKRKIPKVSMHIDL
jgi:hypothetical protein